MMIAKKTLTGVSWPRKGVSGSKEIRLGWQERNEARAISLCPECVRSNLWMIEARLDIDPELGL